MGSARLLVDFLKDTPRAVIMGDLNCTPDSAPIALLREAGFTLAKDTLPPEVDRRTLHKFTGDGLAELDYVLLRGITPLDVRIPRPRRAAPYLSDHDPLEKEFKHSLDSAVASLDFEGIHLNMIDTAGFPDFRGPTLAGMAATETTAVVVNAHNGVELSTRRLMRRAKQRRLCRIIVVNKIDQVGKNTLSSLVDIIREEFGPECLPINLPSEGLTKIRDCFYDEEGETDILSLAEAHEAIIDQVVEVNEELMEKYLEGESLSKEDLHDAFEQALREGHLVPICFTSAENGAGLKRFLQL